MVISQLQAASFAYPEIANGAQAAAAAINAAGGVNGHQVEITACNDQGNPNVAATCARTAVQGNYAAVLNSTTLYAASIMPLLEAGKIPAIGSAITAPEFTSPMSFPVSGGNPLDYGAAGYVAAKVDGCKTAAVIVDTSAAASGTTGPALMKGFVAGGGNPVKTIIKAAATAPDFSAPVSQVASSGAQCLLLGESPQAMAKIIGSLRQSTKPDMPAYSLAVALPQVLVNSMGKAANGVVLTDSVAIPTATATPAFWAQMTKYQPKAEKSGQALLAWIGVNVVKEVAAKYNAYDHDSLVAALQKSTVSIEGAGGPINFSQPNENPAIARVFAKYDFIYKVENGKFVPQNDGKAVNTSIVLK
jgi:ABC-type branched-subunit amino acid transport system substrate-binding protein